MFFSKGKNIIKCYRNLTYTKQEVGSTIHCKSENDAGHSQIGAYISLSSPNKNKKTNFEVSEYHGDQVLKIPEITCESPQAKIRIGSIKNQFELLKNIAV